MKKNEISRQNVFFLKSNWAFIISIVTDSLFKNANKKAQVIPLFCLTDYLLKCFWIKIHDVGEIFSHLLFSTFRDDELEEKLKVSQHFIRIMMATATAPFSSEKEGFTGAYYKKQTNVDSATKGRDGSNYVRSLMFDYLKPKTGCSSLISKRWTH